jgi:hypothetical protein
MYFIHVSTVMPAKGEEREREGGDNSLEGGIGVRSTA